MRTIGLTVAVVMLALPAWAQITVDGTRDAGYGAPLAVQTVETQFGDATPAGGSELDAAYAVVYAGRLYLMLTGNLEQNHNMLEVFIDSKPGGENVLSGTPLYGFSNSSQKFAGMTFDTSFEADYHMFSNWGSASVPAYAFQTEFFERMGGGVASVPGSLGATAAPVALQAAGAILAGNIGPTSLVTALTQNLEFAIDNNNAAGVAGGTAAANQVNAVAVTTGMEFSIALADLGNPPPGTTIRIFAAINNSNHDYFSNQFLGGVPAPQGNLGGDGAGTFNGTVGQIDFTDAVYAAGTQYFTVQVPRGAQVPGVPALTLSGAALLALATAALAWVALARRTG